MATWVFADIGGTLAPAFSTHAALRPEARHEHTRQQVSISQVGGAGEGPSPFTVTSTSLLPGTGLAVDGHGVNGDNFFRLRKTF
jgi:hypothetical protein